MVDIWETMEFPDGTCPIGWEPPQHSLGARHAWEGLKAMNLTDVMDELISYVKAWREANRLEKSYREKIQDLRAVKYRMADTQESFAQHSEKLKEVNRRLAEIHQKRGSNSVVLSDVNEIVLAMRARQDVRELLPYVKDQWLPRYGGAPPPPSVPPPVGPGEPSSAPTVIATSSLDSASTPPSTPLLKRRITASEEDLSDFH